MFIRETNLLEIIENEDSLELIYSYDDSINGLTLAYSPTYDLNTANKKIFKVVYNIVDGKWVKLEPIYGRIEGGKKVVFEDVKYVFN